jgi:hypothetical protein
VAGQAQCARRPGAALPLCTEFFGVPLTGSADLIFLLDRSASMSETASFGDPSQQPGAPSASTESPSKVPSWKSGPLLPDKLTVAKRELTKVLDHLPDGTRFAIAFFDEDITWFAPQLTVLDAQSRSEVHRFVDSIYPRGATGAVPALEAAFALRPRRVVVLSDGASNFDGSDAELLELARAQIKAGVRFDTVSLGSVDAQAAQPDTLLSLARESGGLSQSF